MRARHRKTLELVYSRPVPSGVKWDAVRALFVELGAHVAEREGSRVAVAMGGQVRVFHRPHPSPDMDKAAVASVRSWLEELGIVP
ncbi:type II toxin-antitoxin system HicA family toxin [Pigmentiphaga humi]|uniref:type II toxin-antitoxin system HicA family toxin n=1 Tax=Pigmentiphaga humi TaxID=2478468 RepID=UPI000F52F1BA|nr:type II toxin-antitoxin system HicA family toxin [Pigmentiphaga humi]